MTDRQLTLEDVARYPRPGMNAPNQVKFTSDSQKVSYLQGTPGSLAQELWTYDLPSGERRQVTEMTSGNVSTIGQFSLRRRRSLLERPACPIGAIGGVPPAPRDICVA